MEYTTRGEHVRADYWGVSPALLNDSVVLESLMTEAVTLAGATILSVQHKQFQPQGVTILFLLSESHMSIHTYPEKEFAALDIYTCGYTVKTQSAMEFMREKLRPSFHDTRVEVRGVL